MTHAELDRFLEAHPEVRHVDLFLSDLNTVERGKRIDRAGVSKIFTDGLPLPGSMFALDVRGGTSEATGLGFDDGDADRPCRPLPDSLVPVPWVSGGIAQAQVSMYESDGRPFFGDPRHVLVKVLDRFHRLNLTPVVAVEYEFYFIDRERRSDGLPQPPPLPGSALSPAPAPFPALSPALSPSGGLSSAPLSPESDPEPPGASG